jgi:hypothetical protein
MADSCSQKECFVRVFTPERRLLAFGTLQIKKDRSGSFAYGLFVPDDKSLPPHRKLDVTPQLTVFAESTTAQFELHNWQLVRHFLGDKLHFGCLIVQERELGLIKPEAVPSFYLSGHVGAHDSPRSG